jgi:hypothetical protein
MRPTQACAAGLTAAVAALAIAACGGSNSNKAGGERDVKPTVLTFANANGDSIELEAFADATR